MGVIIEEMISMSDRRPCLHQEDPEAHGTRRASPNDSGTAAEPHDAARSRACLLSQKTPDREIELALKRVKEISK